ncbi:hypothetical protein IPJ72_02890 [Candidatus Peregrinibacteria bacterium]|nr:MAG: hypothetical protein IPJ72_02890 [Candidatus Peregrinibacteria bacterium]
MIKRILFLLTLMVVLLVGGYASSRVSYAQSDRLNDTEYMFDLQPLTHRDVQDQSFIRQGINFIFNRAITIMAATIGSAAVLIMSIGGFRMLASTGNQEEYDKGKGMVTKAVIGLAVALSAYMAVILVQTLINSIYGA